MTRRIGATLVEVLVTIFVMALGLIALLTLFPIGALRMAEAIKDSRSAQAAGNAEAMAIARGLRNDAEIGNRYQQPPTMPAAPQDGPSYPVYLDPIGWRLYSATPLRSRVGEVLVPANNIAIPRTTARFVLTASVGAVMSSFALLDDLTFGPDGAPVDANGRRFGQPGFTELQREGRYTWGLMLKRPRTSTPSVVDLTVVVYSGRPLQLTTGLASPQGENTYDADEGDLEGTTVLVTPSVGQEAPRIRKGGWILDASAERPYNAAANPPDLNKPVLKYGPVHGHFYRVTAVTPESGGRLRLQLETPLKAPIRRFFPSADPTKSDPPNYERTPKIIVMDNVAEVFEKGPGWLP